MLELHEIISLTEAAFQDRRHIGNRHVKEAIEQTISMLDRGIIRVAEKTESGWIVHEWIKKTILLYFSIRQYEVMDAGALLFYDKIPMKRNLVNAGIRVVPPGVARYGSYLESGVILMPGYVNIGAYVGAGTMIDTCATIGSCAQIGKNVHISGGVGIGGVLEPPAAKPVIIEDNAFVGSRSIIVEGVHVEEEAVIGAGVVLTSSTNIIDVTNEKEVIYKGIVPKQSVVIPGTTNKTFPAGTYGVPCALIIGKRTESTDKKTSLNQALRDYGIVG